MNNPQHITDYKTWEYEDDYVHHDRLAKKLGQRGKEGWEAYAIVKVDAGFYSVFFKRSAA